MIFIQIFVILVMKGVKSMEGGGSQILGWGCAPASVNMGGGGRARKWTKRAEVMALGTDRRSKAIPTEWLEAAR